MIAMIKQVAFVRALGVDKYGSCINIAEILLLSLGRARKRKNHHVPASHRLPPVVRAPYQPSEPTPLWAANAPRGQLREFVRPWGNALRLLIDGSEQILVRKTAFRAGNLVRLKLTNAARIFEVEGTGAASGRQQG